MNSELIAALDYFEREKGIKRETLTEAVANALLASSKKAVGPARELRVDINPKTGAIRVLANLIVAEPVTSIHDEISLAKAKKIKPNVQIGESLEVEVTPKDFGRIAAQTAKQAMLQRIRQIEKEMVYDEFKDRAGEIVTGTVRRFERSDVIVDLGKFEAVIPSGQRVPTEDYNIGDRLRAYVVAVENGERGPAIILSRSHPNFVRRLFELEVSELSDRTVEIKALAREAGYRTKIAVYSENPKIDPVGACVGMRGSRVKNIVRELNNEKVDIISWNPDPREFILKALEPARVKSMELDSNRKSALVKVDEDQLSVAIGKRGQNVRLTSRLTGWEINIEKDESAAQVFEQKLNQAAHALAEALQIDMQLADTLIQNGFSNIEALLDAEPSDIAEVLSINLEEATRLYNTAAQHAGKPPAVQSSESTPVPTPADPSAATADNPTSNQSN